MGKDTDATPVEERAGERVAIGRVAVAVDPHSGGQDAAVLGSAIAGAMEAETMLLTVEPDLRLILPGLDSKQMRRNTEAMLVNTRQSVAPEARMRIDTDLSTARGLKRLAARERCHVLAVGSSRRGPDGQVTIGRLTRQLFDELGCAVAIAPRRLSRRPELVLTKIGVAFDDGPESRAALGTAAAIAVGCGAAASTWPGKREMTVVLRHSPSPDARQASAQRRRFEHARLRSGPGGVLTGGGSRRSPRAARLGCCRARDGRVVSQ